MIPPAALSANHFRGATRRSAGTCLAVWRSLLRVAALAVALLSYGAVPSTALVQSEVESQLSEILAEHSHCDVRTRVRGSAGRGDSDALTSAHRTPHGRAERRQAASRLGERLSSGMTLPLRC
jgi:hypothetical protein